METVENTTRVLEHAQWNLEVVEWQAHYHFEEAIYREIMRNPGDTYRMGEERLGLTRYQTTIGVRIYQLFRDHTFALTKLSGINSCDINLVPKKRFEATLRALNRDFPPTPIPEGDLEFEF